MPGTETAPHIKNLALGCTVNCEPGYLTDVIKLIGLAAKTDHSMTDAVLVVDATAIHKGTV